MLKVVGHRWNRFNKPIPIAVPNSLQIQLAIHHRLESCDSFLYGKHDVV